MQNYAEESRRSFSVGDLVKYWDEFNEVYHLGIIVSKDDTQYWRDTEPDNFLVFFADTRPGYLQPSEKHGNLLFSCSSVILEFA